ncbi:S-methyl-5'-thioadenosine phosphorylase [Sporomusa acidovorans]|uniref:Probable 6-oxopurine nucleoside phosphorylase n=1 Tax=Sporomusa acidovorans (strain ATCC 49682 / DSM 3132 / Mol) TaxID=1123286 RepID=A0ABZ3J3R5_SPOA4|nr:S-methyl-5'-thioadenosine phosphorylase [Sporomusa acidovorans]OZC20186.1 S-methyl-5'-thioadenosine phosphorylase [Sporomusa acidovorans DSM 3132]SDD42598.1 methylthioadenosine phosphorylase [Sporomusa acidovorans]
MKIAIIGGTGVYDPKILNNIREECVATPFGIVRFKSGEYAGEQIAFIPRHGSTHSIPPHLINYRANIWAMKKLGVQNIIATTAVGSLNLDMKPGSFVLIDQFLDFVKNRVTTFYEGGERGVVHVDVTTPYCPSIRKTLCEFAQKLNIPIHEQGTYVCTDGPRFETPAEIKMFAKLGGDVVGMTNVPEVVLAREAEMCYATVSMVTNYAAGISPQPLTHHEVLETMQANTENIKQLILSALENLQPELDCTCKHALAEYGGFKL